MKIKLNGVPVRVRVRSLALRDACSKAPTISKFEQDLARYLARQHSAALFRGRVRT